MDRGLITVTYVSTQEQCADSLTKFLRSGQDQKNANAHLSLLDLEQWLPRRELQPKASGARRLSGDREIFPPRVVRVFSGGSELLGPGVPLDPILLVRRKNVCVMLLSVCVKM